jgi:1-deoxy-D-xylulose-5-phosphate reductoisomerase
VTSAARRRGVAILPVDSEHNAIHQCLHGRQRGEIRRLILTASGGPFRELSREALEHVTPAAALQHPTWQMGRKITIDSATLMNKGLEVIEARWLFDVPGTQIDVVIHPQSIVHSMVELTDGSVIARAGRLEFSPPPLDRFPCLGLAYEALAAGGTRPVALNAANEVAVELFLEGKLGFMSIPRVLKKTMDAHRVDKVSTLEVVRHTDAWARAQARVIAGELELDGLRSA